MVSLARAHAALAAPDSAEVAQDGLVLLAAVLLRAEGAVGGLAGEFGRIDGFVEDGWVRRD